ncbi:MAG TPA: hypothetical protein VH678_16275 [Xanthobacteraceae bacterium]
MTSAMFTKAVLRLDITQYHSLHVAHIPINMGCKAREVSMKTTIEMPDDLYRAAKAEAALRGRKLKDLIEEGLRLVLASSRRPRRPTLAQLMEPARGIVNSGVPDLGSNPKHLANFGRNARRDR